MNPGDCARFRPLLGELAVGAVTGHERARVLRHVAACPDCRQELAETTRIADELLLLMPEREPPAGFESAVVARMRAPKPPPGRVGRALRAAAALILVAALAAGAVWWRTAPDRRIADQYRQTLEVADGRYLRAARLTTEAGAPAGHIFFYQGSPSWLLVAITAAPAPGNYAITVVGKDGSPYRIGTCAVAGATGTIGYELPIPVGRISAVELAGPARLVATL